MLSPSVQAGRMPRMTGPSAAAAASSSPLSSPFSSSTTSPFSAGASSTSSSPFPLQPARTNALAAVAANIMVILRFDWVFISFLPSGLTVLHQSTYRFQVQVQQVRVHCAVTVGRFRPLGNRRLLHDWAGVYGGRVTTAC